LRERQDRLDSLGVSLLAVGTREDYQARNLMDEGISVELLLDPEDEIRQLLGAAARFEWWRLLHPAGAVSYAKSLGQAKRFDPIWAEANQRPGILLLDAQLEIAWTKMGSRIGDYPDPDEVIDTVESLIRDDPTGP
jgi:hypothetical protein